MEIFTYIVVAFSLLGALDRIFGNRFGLGEQFEKGLQLYGATALSVIGMLVLAPGIAKLLEPACGFIQNVLHLEPSVLPAMLLANDMGGYSLGQQVAADPQLGLFNGLAVAAMMGVTISFTVPVALTLVPSAKHRYVLLGFLCGIVTVPVGCVISGLLMGLSIGVILWDILPLLVFAAILVVGLLKVPMVCVKVFRVFGAGIKILITFGLALGILRFLTGFELIKGLAPLEDGADICLNACIVMTGTFPFVHLLSKLLNKPLGLLAGKMGIRQESTVGFLSSLASSMTTFGLMEKMDDKGVMLNSAFAISAAFCLSSHLAFTMALAPQLLLPVIVGKLIAGICAVVVALLLSKKLGVTNAE